MHRQFSNGILQIQLQQRPEFLRIVHAQASFDGNRDGRFLKYLVQKRAQLVRMRQESGALSLCGDGAGGAAQVQVHLLIAQLLQLFRCLEKRPRLIGQQLRHQFKAGIILWEHLAQILFCNGRAVGGGGEEGGIVPVHPGEIPVMERTKHVVCDSLQGSKIISHMVHPI